MLCVRAHVCLCVYIRLGGDNFKNICFINYTKDFDCVGHSNLWEILQEIGVPDHLTSLLETCMRVKKQVRTSHGTMDWFKIGEGVQQGSILSLCLFSLYAVYLIQNARLDELQAGKKTARRNNNLRYADDTTLMTKELKRPLMRVKEETEKAGLKYNILKTKIMASSPITSWQTETEKVKQWQILLSWAPKSLRTMTVAMKSNDACSLEGKL